MGIKTKLFLLLSFFLHLNCQVEDTVIICKGSTSYAYHHHECEGLGKCRSGTATVSLSKAKSMGRKACSYCYGKKSGLETLKKDSIHETSLKTKSVSISSQCAAITKKGRRCKRTAKANGYCWQHKK